MKYFSRDEVEKIGKAGSYKIDTDDGPMYRYLSSFWLYVEPEDEAFTPHAKSGFWEAWITKWISQEFDSHETFIDIGANVGYYSMLAATHGLWTFAIEPQRRLCEMIGWSSEANNLKNVRVRNLALSDQPGTLNLIVPTRHSGGAYLQSDDSDIPNGYRLESVKVTTLDESVEMVNKRILIKIDAEGAEPGIMSGGKNFFLRNDVTIVLEWHAPRWPNAREFAQDLHDTFEGKLSVVDFEGNEKPVTIDRLVKSKDLEMVVVRSARTA